MSLQYQDIHLLTSFPVQGLFQHHEFFQFFQLPDQLRVPVFFDRIPDETGKHPVIEVAVIGTVEVDLPDFHAAVRNGIQEIDVPAQQRNRNIRLQLA